MDWYEDDAFWIELYPFLFTESRLENAANEVESILSRVPRPVRSALDLCCGPGRHSIALAKRGVQVTAVDRTERYLEIAKERARREGWAIEWVLEDMRRFVRREAYDLALIMFTSFGFFEDEKDDLKVLHNVYESLVCGGALVMELAGKEWIAEHYEETSSDDLPDGSVLVQRHKVIDDWRRIQNQWILIKEGRARTFSFDHRIYSGTELADRLGQTGFRSVSLFGDLEGGEFTYGAKRLVAMAVK